MRDDVAREKMKLHHVCCSGSDLCAGAAENLGPKA
jgi:hypothetical protein